MTNWLDSQRFQKAVMRSGMEFLTHDCKQSFAFLGSLKCNTVGQALQTIRMLPIVSYPTLFRALPKRKPPTHLAAAGVALTEDERRVIESYEMLNSSFVWESKLNPVGEPRILLATLTEQIAPILGEVERSSDGEAYFFRLRFNDYLVNTNLSSGGRQKRIVYHHSIFSPAGDQLNALPFSLLEMCGLSAVTSWTSSEKLGASEIVEDAVKCIRVSLGSIQNLMS